MCDCDCYWGRAVKLLTSFGFRVGLVVASHLLGLIVLIAGGEWLALVWLVVASMWATVAFMQESRAESQAILIEGLARIARVERNVS